MGKYKMKTKNSNDLIINQLIAGVMAHRSSSSSSPVGQNNIIEIAKGQIESALRNSTYH